MSVNSIGYIHFGGDIRNITILLLLSLLTLGWGQDCEEGYTEMDGECYYQSDLDVLQQFIDNSQEGNPYPPPSNMRPIDLGVQEWENGRIVFLCYSFIGQSECYIYDYMLSGEIPQDIGNLTNLKYLSFSYSQLHGQIPASIGNLTHLTELKLHFNHLSGEIPNGIGNMVDLTHLYLRGNQFIGGIPDEIWNLVNLDRLYLEHNQLTGEIPPEIGNLVNLRYINLKDNQLNGEIPESIGNLTNIIGFSLSNNQLSGVIPYSICNFAQDNPYVWVYANQLCPPYPECLTDEQINGSWNTPGGEDDHQDTSGCQQLGDINGDGQLNILDIVLAANMVLADEYDELADMNEDGELNILDLVIMVNLVLYGDAGACIDIDGNVYETVQIGDQLWMAENLRVTHYNDGSEITHITNNGDWGSFEEGQYSVYDNDPANADIYGNLYNFAVVDDDRGVCPDGFHVPPDEEFIQLEMELGMSEEDANDTGWRGTNEGSKLAGNSDLWNSGDLENNSEFGTSGFNVLPAGYRSLISGSYFSMGNNGYFWSSSEVNSNNAWIRNLFYNYSNVYRYYSNKPYGHSVRCVQD